jgi:hypothetical protein
MMVEVTFLLIMYGFKWAIQDYSHLRRCDEAQEQDDLTREKESEPSISLGWGLWAGEEAPTTKVPKSNKGKFSQLPK